VKDPRRHIFRYDDHMPDTEDLALVVLKGHLLVEEVLVELTVWFCPIHRILIMPDLVSTSAHVLSKLPSPANQMTVGRWYLR